MDPLRKHKTPELNDEFRRIYQLLSRRPSVSFGTGGLPPSKAGVNGDIHVDTTPGAAKAWLFIGSAWVQLSTV